VALALLSELRRAGIAGLCAAHCGSFRIP
jgi:hypothetical protein